jgi:SAM-dependent methyltransferase
MITNPQVDGQDFFEQMASYRGPYRILAQCIENVTHPKSVLDIGCGCGHAVTYFDERGIPAYGWDGDPASKLHSERPDLIRILDFRDEIILPTRYDLVICTETAEHIDEEFGSALVDTVAESVGRILVWSAAQSGQEWPGHVNLQHPDYWIAKLEPYGLSVDLAKTLVLRDLMVQRHAQHEYCASNFVVMVRA